MPSNGNGTANRVYDSLNDGYDALIDAVRAANDRGHRVSTALIEDAQRSQREAVELVKRWADAPLDILGLYSAFVENTTKVQSRALEATREWFGEMANAQQESRQVIQRIATANRSAGEAAMDAARGAFSRAGEVVQNANRSTPAAATAGDGRRSRETARASDSSDTDS
ncbi:MAG: hypothetical protein WEE64_12515 [Dehalococcoidia bacterium]